MKYFANSQTGLTPSINDKDLGENMAQCGSTVAELLIAVAAIFSQFQLNIH